MHRRTFRVSLKLSSQAQNFESTSNSYKLQVQQMEPEAEIECLHQVKERRGNKRK
jgi:hypothetical protein